MSKYNMYYPKCRKWVMAEETVTDTWRKTPHGATKLKYTCPLCGDDTLTPWQKGRKP